MNEVAKRPPLNPAWGQPPGASCIETLRLGKKLLGGGKGFGDFVTPRAVECAVSERVVKLHPQPSNGMAKCCLRRGRELASRCGPQEGPTATEGSLIGRLQCKRNPGRDRSEQ